MPAPPSRLRLLFRSIPLGLLAFPMAAGCGPDAGSGIPRNLVLVVVDTLRRDALGCYGAARDTSPHVDALAREGVRLTRAYTPAPWTQPAVASLLTGLMPTSHGLTRIRHALPDELPTLAERLAEVGFATAAVVSHILISPRYGFDQGFEHFFESEAGGRSQVSTRGVTEQAIGLLADLADGGRRFFLLVHYFDPHDAFQDHPEVEFAAPAAGRLAGTQAIRPLRRLSPALTPIEARQLRALYDEEIRHTDAGIGRLLAALKALGLAKHTLVVVTSDHGEELGEHGWIGHTRHLYDEVLAVPFVARGPGLSRGAVVDTPVSTVALTPTLLDILEVPSEPDAFQAASFAPLLRGEATEPDLPIAEVDFVPWLESNREKRTRKQALVSGHYKLIRDEATGTLELFDLRADPGERDNLVERETDRAEAMAAALAARQAAAAARTAPRAIHDPDPQEVEALRALGYVDP